MRRDRPDYMIMFGWGAMNPTAVKEAAKVNYPMDKFISIWWPGDDDMKAAGDGSKGFKMLNWHSSNPDYKALADINKYVVDKGKSLEAKEKVGNLLYNRGVYNSMLIAEGIRSAQKITGKKVINGEDMRRGLENLNVDAARLKEIGMEGYAAPFKLTCANHNGNLATFVQQWDGAKWVKVSDWIQPLTANVQPLLDDAAKTYVEKNAPWPARSEPCDNKS